MMLSTKQGTCVTIENSAYYVTSVCKNNVPKYTELINACIRVYTCPCKLNLK